MHYLCQRLNASGLAKFLIVQLLPLAQTVCVVSIQTFQHKCTTKVRLAFAIGTNRV